MEEAGNGRLCGDQAGPEWLLYAGDSSMTPGARTAQDVDAAAAGGVGLDSASRPFLVHFLYAVVAVSGLALALEVGDGTTAAKTLSDLSFLVAPGVAGWACLRRARSQADDEASWRWMGGSCLLWAAGGAVWAFDGVTRDHDYPFPSLADVGFLGYAVPAAIGLVGLRSPALPGRFRLAGTLDAAVIAAAVLFVSWATVLGDLYAAPVDSRLERVVGLAYPVVDVAMVSLVLVLGMRRPAGCRLPWLVLGAGFATLAVSDSLYVERVLSGGYQGGHLFDVAWSIAFALVALAATAPGRPAPPGEGRLTLTQELLPYLPVLAALAVGATLPVSLSDRPFLFWNGLILLALLAVRQVVVVSRKIALADDMERRVAERTAELVGEREFLAAVLESLEEGVVACDGDGVLTVFNDATRRLHGLPAEPIPAEEWARHYSLRQADGVTPLTTEQIPLLRALAGELVHDEELVIAPEGGRHRLVRCTGRAIAGPDGAQLGAVVAMHDITDRRRAQLDLEHQAFHDALTGLGNRARFDAGVTAMLLHAQAERRPLAVVLADLDDFKRVNDSLGHEAGDLLLVEVSRRLRGCVRDGDLSVRLGGDEFVFVLQSSTSADAVAVAGRMLAALARPLAVEGTEVLVDASIGIVGDSHGSDAKELLRGADLAMYEAKHKGRGGYVVFDPAMQVLADERLALESEMRSGLRDGDFRLVYQPVVSLSTGVLTAVEALLRWDRPGRPPMSPVEFVPVAERTGLIVPLGEWVLAEACGQLVCWDASTPEHPALSVAVNVSLYQLDRPGFTDSVRSVLASTGLDPGRLVLEITESALRDDEPTAALLGELHGIGVKLSIDDFGTGYSSLARLRTSSVDCVMLDRSFVAEIDGDSAEVPLVVAMVVMAHGLGLRTVAEGIETAEQFNYLLGLGCDEGQGYLMSRPVTPCAIAEMLGTTAPERNAASPGWAIAGRTAGSPGG
jgi:diguanylate cyclase (GGDEF)-like protein/PAS domain S-box-containing protein